MSQEQQNREPVVAERVQTGVRLEKRMLKVLKAIAEQKDMTSRSAGRDRPSCLRGQGAIHPQTLKEIEQFKTLYGMTLKAADSHNLKEKRK